MTHYMKLNPEPFDKIASGRKTIELRLYDEKRKLVRPADEIVFTHIRNPYRSISVIVDSVITAASFESLFKHISLVDCGYEEKEITGNRGIRPASQLLYFPPGIGFEAVILCHIGICRSYSGILPV